MNPVRRIAISPSISLPSDAVTQTLAGIGRKGVKAAYEDLASLRRAEGRFFKNVDMSDGLGPTGKCWLWTGYTRNGYGSISICNRLVYTHRLSYFYRYGRWPALKACHSCDTRHSVNPEHLTDASQDFNLADMRAKGRGSDPPRRHGERHHMVTISDSDAAQIRDLMAAGATQRSIAAKFGISNSTAWRIGKGITRRSA